MNQKECLQILEFGDVDAPSIDEIKKRWKELCRKYHPDLGGEKEDFLRVTHAYKILTDPSYAHSQSNSMDDTDLTVNIQYVLSFEDAFSGKRKCMVSYSIMEIDPETNDPIPPEEGGVPVEHHVFEVKPGAFQKDPLIVRGKGNKKGDRRGDLRVIFVVKKHARFQPERYIMGWNIVAHETFPLHELLKGTRRKFQTMKGFREVSVPPGTSPGEVLVIRGCGVGGDHKIVVHVAFPTKKDLKSENYKGMEIKWEEEKEDEDMAKFESDFLKETLGYSGGNSRWTKNRKA